MDIYFLMSVKLVTKAVKIVFKVVLITALLVYKVFIIIWVNVYKNAMIKFMEMIQSKFVNFVKNLVSIAKGVKLRKKQKIYLQQMKHSVNLAKMDFILKKKLVSYVIKPVQLVQNQGLINVLLEMKASLNYVNLS